MRFSLLWTTQIRSFRGIQLAAVGWGAERDNYLYSQLQVDLQGTCALPAGLSLVGYGLNLNNQVFGCYNGSTAYKIQREIYKSTFSGGLRWSSIRRR